MTQSVLKKAVLAVLSLTFITQAASADLASGWKSVMDQRKGPFGGNVQQGSNGRVGVLDGAPPGKHFFQAAFRNDTARAFATSDDFYLGNLFTTNYFELMGEYVYSDAYGSHDLDHAALLAQAETAMPKAMSMIRHQLLERYYIEHFRDAKLARAFKIRGISDSENERQFAGYMFNFMIAGIQDTEYDYLPTYLLLSDSPIAASGSLQTARDGIAYLYDTEVAYSTKDSAVSKRLYQLRNAIHNTLSEDVIVQISKFKKDFPEYSEDMTLQQIQEILVAYYEASSAKVASAAKKLGLSEIEAAARILAKSKTTPDLLLVLSKAVVAARISIADTSVIPFEKKTDAMLVLSLAARYMSKEINKMKRPNSVAVFQVLLDTMFTEGFLVQSNWEYFSEKLNEGGMDGVADIVQQATEIAGDTVVTSMGTALEQWVSLEPKMQGFVDNVIKSSSINAASVALGKL